MKFIIVERRCQYRGFYTWEFHDLLECSKEVAEQEYPHSYAGGEYELQQVRARVPKNKPEEKP